MPLVFRFILAAILMLPQGICLAGESQLSELLHKFAPLPSGRFDTPPCFPTPNTRLVEGEEDGYVARTRTNDRYGFPGWTREQGGRFHKGVDILPVQYEKLKQTVRISYYDPHTRSSFSKREPVLVPKDEIYSVLGGKVIMANQDEARSGYGRYIMIEHTFPDGSPFISMYAHLNNVEVKKGQELQTGERIGWMGTTSSNAGGRNYLKAIPHCHFEIGRVINNGFERTVLAKMLYPKMLGGRYDPRNIQPFDPIQFLRKYNAQPVVKFVPEPVESDSEQGQTEKKTSEAKG
jgi:peptidoglycan LD-endopeptidase LytH